jgi:hypothetical protein
MRKLLRDSSISREESDQSRLVAAYSLALAATSQEKGVQHPGFLVLDEPLQQNPDDSHKELFFTFLEKQLAQQSKFQTLIFTWLSDVEINRLRKQNTVVITPPGEHFLQLRVAPTKENDAVTTAKVSVVDDSVPPTTGGPK